MDLFAIASDGSLRWTWWDANYNGGGWLHPTGLYTATTLFQISSSNEFIPGAAVAATVPNHNFIVLAAFGSDGDLMGSWWNGDGDKVWHGPFVAAFLPTAMQLNLGTGGIGVNQEYLSWSSIGNFFEGVGECVLGIGEILAGVGGLPSYAVAA